MNPRPTLEDVGRVAGVSAKTVSNVLLGRPNVSDVTRARVWEAVAATGYVANAAGRGLASGRTGRIALVVPNLHQPYFAEMAERLMAELAPHGLTSTLIIARTGEAVAAVCIFGSGLRLRGPLLRECQREAIRTAREISMFL